MGRWSTRSKRWASRCGGESWSCWPSRSCASAIWSRSSERPQPLVSHHLKVLRDGGIVESSKFRYWTYYRLRPEALGPLATTLTSIAATRAAVRRPSPTLLLIR